jgi:hypothetical protein
MATPTTHASNAGTAETVQVKAKLRTLASALRNDMDAGEYRLAVLALIFTCSGEVTEAKYIERKSQHADGINPEKSYDCAVASIFPVGKELPLSHLNGSAPQPTIGNFMDGNAAAAERNKSSRNFDAHHCSRCVAHDVRDSRQATQATLVLTAGCT